MLTGLNVSDALLQDLGSVMFKMWSFRPNHLPILLLIAYFSYALSLAMLMTAWGTHDEPYHYDYVDRLSTGSGTPRLASDYLSQSLVSEMIADRRWSKLGWPAPETDNPADWGLEGKSYQGHQPPLFYSTYAFILKVVPLENHTSRLFLLRCVSVAVSTLSVVLLFLIINAIFPQRRYVAILSIAPFILAPARLIAVTQVTNDVFAEFFGMAVVYIVILALKKGLRPSIILLLLLALGGAAATKITTVLLLIPALYALYFYRTHKFILRYFLFFTVLGLILITPTIMHLASVFSGESADENMTTLALFGQFEGGLIDSSLIAAAGLIFSRIYTYYMFDLSALRALLFGFHFWISVLEILFGAYLCLRSDKIFSNYTRFDLAFARVLAIIFLIAFLGLQILAHAGMLPPADSRFLLPYLWGPVILVFFCLMYFPYMKYFASFIISLICLQSLFLFDAYILEVYARSDFSASLGGFFSSIYDDKPTWVLSVLATSVLVTFLSIVLMLYLYISYLRDRISPPWALSD